MMMKKANTKVLPKDIGDKVKELEEKTREKFQKENVEVVFGTSTTHPQKVVHVEMRDDVLEVYYNIRYVLELIRLNKNLDTLIEIASNQKDLIPLMVSTTKRKKKLAIV